MILLDRFYVIDHFSFQESVNAYADPTKDLDFEVREARLQDPKNRQNSVVTDDVEVQAMWEDKQRNVIDASLDAYNWAIDNGIAKEQARAVLPEGNTVSRMYVNGTLRSWVHYIEYAAPMAHNKNISILLMQ